VKGASWTKEVDIDRDWPGDFNKTFKKKKIINKQKKIVGGEVGR